jgi:carbamoyl-phosphate synthase large subunit
MWLREQKLSKLTTEELRELKGRGFSDAQIGRLVGSSMMAVRAHRKALGVTPSYKRVDTCAAEFAVRREIGLSKCYSASTLLYAFQ